MFEAFSFGFLEAGLSYSAALSYIDADSRVVLLVVKSCVAQALDQQTLAQVNDASIDDTSFAKGHKYVTILTYSERKKLAGIRRGKFGEAVQTAINEMEERGSMAELIKQAGNDFMPAFISACLDKLENTKIVFDRFRVWQMLTKAVNNVRKLEAKGNKELRKSKYLWLRNSVNLKEKQQEKVHYLSKTPPVLGTAYQLKEAYKEIFNNAKKKAATEALEV